MSDGLRECPFCGSIEPIVRVWANSDAFSPFGIECLNCGIMIMPDAKREYAVAAWNHRATDAPPMTEILDYSIIEDLLICIRIAEDEGDTGVAERVRAWLEAQLPQEAE